METVKIVGIRKMQNSKDKNRVGTTIYFTQSFDDYTVKNATFVNGCMCGEEFTYMDIDCNVGDEVELVYRKGFQNVAVLSAINVVKPVIMKQVPGGNTKQVPAGNG